MELRKDLIKLSGGSLLGLPTCSVDIHFRSENLPIGAIILMPHIIDFIS
jgi:hypothetical protein